MGKGTPAHCKEVGTNAREGCAVTRAYGLSIGGRALYGGIAIRVFLDGEEIAKGTVDLCQWDRLRGTQDFHVVSVGADDDDGGRDAR
jgi:hypothetical protein